jgi:predicted RNA-binding protein YlqC (UPF0109 family)
MSTIDQQFVEYIVKSVVGNPDAVQITRTVDERGVLLELTVDANDLGRVIGKRGSGAQALRTLLRALGTKNDARYNLKIVDNGEAPAPREESSSPTETTDTATEEVAEVSKEADVAEEPEEAPAEESSRAAQTRRELADLDDLDI